MKRIAEFWDDAIVPTLVEYIRIPAKSPHFDKAWEKNGHIDAAVKLAEAWCRKHALPGMKMEVVRLPGRTPVLFIEIEGKAKGTVLMTATSTSSRRWSAGTRAPGRGSRASPTASSTGAAEPTMGTQFSVRSPFSDLSSNKKEISEELSS